jgi:hypothetical protein
MRRGHRCGWVAIVAAGLIVATDGAGTRGRELPKPPELLADLLKVEPAWRMLDPTIDLVGDYTIAQLEDLDRWPPWIEGDFDKDGEDDIAAVVVRKGAGGATEFTVVAVHHKTRGRGELVVPFGPQRIFAVSDVHSDETITPMLCTDCDLNVWYRWNGRSYEPWLHTVGASVQITGEPGRRLTLFADPRADATRTTDIPLCVRAEVLQVGGREGQRWYRVQVDAPGDPTGWVPQQLVVSDADCGA